jgi:CelD/BcsL family acetyltransferase involved in cellulose biosynthesis
MVLAVAAQSLTTDVHALSPQALGTIGAEWTELERLSERPHYSLAHGWLTAWATVYRPRRLLLVRVTARDGTPRALGLIHAEPGRRWRFAGGAVSPHRRLLCPEHESAAWAAWGHWLAQHRARWAVLEGSGVPDAAGSVPGARLEPAPEFALSLPEDFDAYLRARSSGTRRKFNRLARFDAAVREVEPARHAATLERFVALHAARAEQKGERHPVVDGRLCRLLLALPAASTPHLRLFELTAAGRTLGVTIRIDHGSTAYFYNAGFDPAASAMSPGIVLELASIRDAIESGLARFDLGPGDYRYKRDLGGERRDNGRRLIATSPSRLGAAAGVAYRLRRTARARFGTPS